MAPKAAATSIDFGHLKDKKLEKGKKDALAAAEQWKGPNHKERQADKVESKKKIQKAQIAREEKASWKKQAGAGCAILFLCGVGMFNFVATIMDFMAGTGVVDLDERDTTVLKQVLFSGEPWLVYCVNNDTITHRLPKVLEDSARTLHSSLGLQTGVLKCWDTTESGRSVAQRFKLKKSPPLSFVVANTDKPKVVDLVGVSKPEDLEKKLKPALKVDTHRVNSLQVWSSKCASRRACVVVGHKWPAQKDEALKQLRPLLEKHRDVKVVTVDTSIWQLKLDEPVMATRPAKEKGQKSADIFCLARKAGEAGANETFLGRFLDPGLVTTSAFLTACGKQEGLVALGKQPRIQNRPSKKPKVVTPEPWRPSADPTPRPTPPPKKKKPAKGNVDAVGSRDRMEQDEALFEAVDQDEADEDEDEASSEDDEDADDGSEVEL